MRPEKANYSCPELATMAFVVLILLPCQFTLAAADFKIDDAQIRLEGNQYFLDADIDYRLSDTALEALNNGVPLTFKVRLKLDRERPWWLWNDEIASLRLRYQLRYHALAQLYQVVRLGTDVQRNFASRSAAIRALGTIRNLLVVTEEPVEPDQRYAARLRAELDIEALPLPLRPLAYVSPSWHLASEWYRWRPEY